MKQTYVTPRLDPGAQAWGLYTKRDDAWIVAPRFGSRDEELRYGEVHRSANGMRVAPVAYKRSAAEVASDAAATPTPVATDDATTTAPFPVPRTRLYRRIVAQEAAELRSELDSMTPTGGALLRGYLLALSYHETTESAAREGLLARDIVRQALVEAEPP